MTGSGRPGPRPAPPLRLAAVLCLLASACGSPTPEAGDASATGDNPVPAERAAAQRTDGETQSPTDAPVPRAGGPADSPATVAAGAGDTATGPFPLARPLYYYDGQRRPAAWALAWPDAPRGAPALDGELTLYRNGRCDEVIDVGGPVDGAYLGPGGEALVPAARIAANRDRSPPSWPALAFRPGDCPDSGAVRYENPSYSQLQLKPLLYAALEDSLERLAGADLRFIGQPARVIWDLRDGTRQVWTGVQTVADSADARGRRENIFAGAEVAQSSVRLVYLTHTGSYQRWSPLALLDLDRDGSLELVATAHDMGPDPEAAGVAILRRGADAGWQLWRRVWFLHVYPVGD